MLLLNCWLLVLPIKRSNLLMLICQPTLSFKRSRKLLRLNRSFMLLLRCIYSVITIKNRVLAITYFRNNILFLTWLLVIFLNHLLGLNRIKWVKIVSNKISVDEVCISSLCLLKASLTLIIHVFISYSYFVLSRVIACCWLEMILASFDLSTHSAQRSASRYLRISNLWISQ